MTNNIQNTDFSNIQNTYSRAENSQLNRDDRQTKIQELYNKLSLKQNNNDENSNREPRNSRIEGQPNEENGLRNSEVRFNQTLSQNNTQPELINFKSYKVEPEQAQQIVGIIHDIKISGLELSNKFLQEKLSNIGDPREQEMIKELLMENNQAISKANADKLNQELNKKLQEIIQQSQIMDFIEQIEQSEKNQKQRKAESNFAFQTSPENNSQLGGILGEMGISFQTVSGEKDSNILVIDQDVNNQMAVQNIEQQISQYQSQFQSQSQSQITSQSQSQGGSWVNVVSQNNKGNQTSISENTVSKPVVGSYTAALAKRGQSGMVLTATSNGR
jgi:hypothetical protein